MSRRRHPGVSISRRTHPRAGAAILIALAALFVALGGTVYAARKINGSSIRVKSLPANRLKPHSVGAGQLRPNVLGGTAAPSGPISGSQIDERSLGQVPSADYADSAGTALTATDAQTATNAINAIHADTINGHGAGCQAGTVPFAGACWQASASEAAATAPIAATACATQGGSLPEALQLAAFSQEDGVALKADEWTINVVNSSGPNLYAVSTVTPTGAIDFSLSTNTKHYRCVIPLVV